MALMSLRSWCGLVYAMLTSIAKRTAEQFPNFNKEKRQFLTLFVWLLCNYFCCNTLLSTLLDDPLITHVYDSAETHVSRIFSIEMPESRSLLVFASNKRALYYRFQSNFCEHFLISMQISLPK